MNIEHRGQETDWTALPPALAQFLAEDPHSTPAEGMGLSQGQAEHAEAALVFLLAEAPTPQRDLSNGVLSHLPEGDPAAFARLGEAVLDAWCDKGLNRRWREDPPGMAAALALPAQLAASARVVEADAGGLPQPGALDIPLPSLEDPIPSRGEALRRLAATDFGWLLATLPGGAGALGLLLPTERIDAEAAAPGFFHRVAEFLLRPRFLLAAGSLACLVVAVGLVMGGAPATSDVSGAAVGALSVWRLLGAVLSLGGALLLARAARRS